MNAKPMNVRPLAERDKEDWHRLWAGYLEFYGAEVSDEVTAHTWERLMDRDYPVWGLVAEADGEVAGILNYVLTSTVESRKSLILAGSHFRLGTTSSISSGPSRASPALRRVGTG